MLTLQRTDAGAGGFPVRPPPWTVNSPPSQHIGGQAEIITLHQNPLRVTLVLLAGSTELTLDPVEPRPAAGEKTSCRSTLCGVVSLEGVAHQREQVRKVRQKIVDLMRYGKQGRRRMARSS